MIGEGTVMRLYGKLLAIVLAAAGVQWSIQNRQHARDVWFVVRCQIAHMTNDAALEERLVAEAGDMYWAAESTQVVNATGGG